MAGHSAYNGQRVDPVTGSYHLGEGYRLYDPSHRGFYQPDDWSPLGAGGLNDRAYCADGDPVNWHDPSGHIMINRQDAAASLARIDDFTKAVTIPPKAPEAATWQEWAFFGVMVVLAAVAIIGTGGALAPFLFAGLVVGAGLTAAGMALRQQDPALSQILEPIGHVVMALASLPAAGAQMAGAAKYVMYGLTFTYVGLEIAKVSVQSSNPRLAEGLGWAATAFSVLAAVVALPVIAKGLNAMREGIRSMRSTFKTVNFAGLGRSRETVYRTISITKPPSKVLPGRVSKQQRDLINASRPATPPATPGTSRRLHHSYPVEEVDLGEFTLYRRKYNSSPHAVISTHGGIKLRGGKVEIPAGSQLHHYGARNGTATTKFATVTTKKPRFPNLPHPLQFPKSTTTVTNDRGLEAIASGVGRKVKTVPGGHITGNYVLDHFETYSNSNLHQIVEKFNIDILTLKPGARSHTLAEALDALKSSGRNYSDYHACFCRLPETLSDLAPSFLIPTNKIVPPGFVGL